MIGTCVMKELRRSSPIILRKSFLKRYKADFDFFNFIFIWIFSRIFTIHRTAGEGEAIFLQLFFHFHSLHRHLDIGWVIAAEVTSAHKWQLESNREPLIFYCTSLISELRALLNSPFLHLDW